MSQSEVSTITNMKNAYLVDRVAALDLPGVAAVATKRGRRSEKGEGEEGEGSSAGEHGRECGCGLKE